VLRCEGLTKSFDGVQALANVHSQFPESGTAAIIGPNGAGKSTLLKAVFGLLPLWHGQVKVREVLKIAQRVYVLRNGLVSFSGTAQSLTDNSKLRQVYL
jgi:ABC-type branched-subunit amino acid transport system ATPase component